MLEARPDGEGTSRLERLHAVRREWLQWSVTRMEKEAVEVLGKEEPVEVRELPDEDLGWSIGVWEPVQASRRTERRGLNHATAKGRNRGRVLPRHL